MEGWIADPVDYDDLNGVEEFKSAIEKFNDANKDVVTYEPDYSTAILLAPAKDDMPAAVEVAKEICGIKKGQQ